MALSIIGLALLFFLGHGLTWFFHRTKVPDLLILIIIGYILGPVTGVIDAVDLGQVGAVLSTVALIVILYEGGIHLPAKDLLTSSLPAAGLSLLGFFLIATLGTLIAHLVAGQPWQISLLFGIGIGSTSSAIVIPMVKPLSINENTKTILSLESAFTDVLTIVIFLVLVQSFTSGIFKAQDLAVGVGPKTLLALLMGLTSGCVWAFIKKRFSELVDMAFAGEAWALLTYGLIETSGHNGAIGVFALGFMLANLNLLPGWMQKIMSARPVSYTELSLLSEITFLLRTFFFIYLGLLIRLSNLHNVLIAIFITILIFITRYFSVRLMYAQSKYQQLDAMISVFMGPRGLACAVLATVPLQHNIVGGEWLQNTMFAVIPITILLTAISVGFAEQVQARGKVPSLFAGYLSTAKPSKNEQHEI